MQLMCVKPNQVVGIDAHTSAACGPFMLIPNHSHVRQHDVCTYIPNTLCATSPFKLHLP